MSQCDGCRRGLPVDEYGQHYIRGSWIEDKRTPYFSRETFKERFACTKHLYESNALSSNNSVNNGDTP